MVRLSPGAISPSNVLPDMALNVQQGSRGRAGIDARHEIAGATEHFYNWYKKNAPSAVSTIP
jgi:hypothetical protein